MHTRCCSRKESARGWFHASWEIFDQQTSEYRHSVLPPGATARLAIEQASTFGWERYVGTSGRIIEMNTFGASAPLKELQRRFVFEPERVAAAARELLDSPPTSGSLLP
jgi:transketolase